MTETAVQHKDNDSPIACAAEDDQGVRVDSDEGDDPKSGGTPVHRAPSEDFP